MVRRLTFVWFVTWLTLGLAVIVAAFWTKANTLCPDGGDFMCRFSRSQHFQGDLMLATAMCLMARLGTLVARFNRQ